MCFTVFLEFLGVTLGEAGVPLADCGRSLPGKPIENRIK